MSSPRPAPAVASRRLPTIRPSEQVDRLNLLVYGKPGVGKTVLAGTAEDDERSAPVLFVDAEGGWLSISHRGSTGKLELYPLLNFSEDINALLEFFYLPDGTKTNSGYKTLVVDSLTEVATRAMDSVIQETGTRRALPGVPEFADWNVWTNKMRGLIRFFRDLPLHLIATALEEEVDGSVIPMFAGKKIGPVLPGFFNQVGRLYVAPVPNQDGKGMHYERRLMLQSDARVMAKDRSDRLGTLPREIVDPTVSKLLDRMAEGRKLAAASVKPLLTTTPKQP